jgi:hypothetical protein
VGNCPASIYLPDNDSAGRGGAGKDGAGTDGSGKRSTWYNINWKALLAIGSASVIAVHVGFPYWYDKNRQHLILYLQMSLGRQRSAQGVRPTKKVVLSTSDFAVLDPRIVGSEFHRRSTVYGLPAGPPITPPVLAELLRLRHTTVTGIVKVNKGRLTVFSNVPKRPGRSPSGQPGRKI